jgi:hypothetical protein
MRLQDTPETEVQTFIPEYPDWARYPADASGAGRVNQ